MKTIKESRFWAMWIERLLSCLIILLTGVRSQPLLTLRERKGGGRVYYANHNSHGDFMLIWVSLPAMLRGHVRPVAAADYWLSSPLRRFIACKVFNMVLVVRKSGEPQAAITQMAEALDEGADLIIFPEGTRNSDDTVLLQPFKSGIYHLAQTRPECEFVPVWIHNIQRVLPKGRLLPVPMLCSVRFGSLFRGGDFPEKEDFLAYAQTSLLAQQPILRQEERGL
ncbi:MAG: lysophospholipid acyltransferase family protein [Cardiobacteriaceae bacterium]|nr:lysophospholipid acyltransferase family protein [Cardiobacteriaceae bacterium]